MSSTEDRRRPLVLAFAGPNGSGKTTLARALPAFGTHVNADDLKAAHGLTGLEAARHAESLRNRLLDAGTDFSFETVLSTERNLLLLERANQRGYEVQCVYVLTCDENINVARVMARRASGGHGVPEEKIRSRYRRALALLPRLVGICDKMLIYEPIAKRQFCNSNGVGRLRPERSGPRLWSVAYAKTQH
jgi:predicted ABC-type ATPase